MYLLCDVGTNRFPINKEYLRNADEKSAANLLIAFWLLFLNRLKEFHGQTWTFSSIFLSFLLLYHFLNNMSITVMKVGPFAIRAYITIDLP